MSVVKTYLLENLCCTNCAAAIEREVSALQNVTNAKVEFNKTKITVDFDGEESGLLDAVANIAAEIDEDIVIREI